MDNSFNGIRGACEGQSLGYRDTVKSLIALRTHTNSPMFRASIARRLIWTYSQIISDYERDVLFDNSNNTTKQYHNAQT